MKNTPRYLVIAQDIINQIQEGKLQKEYLAVLTKRPEEDSGELHDLLFHDRFKNKTFVVSKERKGVKKAALSYRVLAESNGRCLVHVRLSTGRTHQIRVQFASRGCPIAGDGKYGGKGSAPLLWSYRLAFPDPRDGTMRIFEQRPEGSAWDVLFAEQQQ